MNSATQKGLREDKKEEEKREGEMDGQRKREMGFISCTLVKEKYKLIERGRAGDCLLPCRLSKF